MKQVVMVVGPALKKDLDMMVPAWVISTAAEKALRKSARMGRRKTQEVAAAIRQGAVALRDLNVLISDEEIYTP